MYEWQKLKDILGTDTTLDFGVGILNYYNFYIIIAGRVAVTEAHASSIRLRHKYPFSCIASSVQWSGLGRCCLTKPLMSS